MTSSKELINTDIITDYTRNIDGMSNSRISGLIGIMNA